MASRPAVTLSRDKKLDLLMKAWEKVQDKQIHFDDMIVRTRSLTFSVMVAGFAAIAAIAKSGNLAPGDDKIFVAVLGAFWLSALLIDQFYYHALLRGAVRTGDLMQNDLEDAGVSIEDVNRDLTRAISPLRARFVIWLYYLVPLLPMAYLLLKDTALWQQIF